MQEKLEYEALILILAIIGLPLCCCAGIGIIPAGIAYFIANNELKKCYERTEPYSNQNNIYTGKIIALVVLILNALLIIRIIYVINVVGLDVIIEQSMEQTRQMMEQYQQ